jgi:hypothetical protein
MTYWTLSNGKTTAGRAREVEPSMLDHIRAVMRGFKRAQDSKPDVTCYLVSAGTWQKLQARVPTEDVRQEKFCSLTLNTVLGVPIFVYHSSEERVRLRLSLLAAGHHVGEVDDGPVL